MPEQPRIHKFKANTGSILTRQLFLILTALTLVGSTYALGGTPQNGTSLLILSIGTALATTSWALMWLFRKHSPLRIHHASYYLIPFLVWSGLNTFIWSAAPWYSKAQWTMWLCAALFFACLINYNRRNQRDNQWPFFACIISGGLAGIIGYLQHFYQPGWLPLDQSIPLSEITGTSGPFYEESNMAALLLLVIPCVYSALRYPIFATPIRALMGFLFPFLILILLLTHEVWAILIMAALFVILPFFCEERKRDRAKKSFLSLMIALLLVLFLTYANPPTKEHFKNIPKEATQRLEAFKSDLKLDKQWFAGKGFGYNRSNIDSIHYRQQNDEKNSWLTLTNEEGVLGVVLLLLPFLAIWIRFFKNWLKTPYRSVDAEKAYREKTDTDMALERKLQTTQDPEERKRIQSSIKKRKQSRQHRRKKGQKKEIPPIERFYYAAIVPATFAFFVHSLIFNHITHASLLLVVVFLLAIMFRVEQNSHPNPSHSIRHKAIFASVLIGLALYQSIAIYPEAKASKSLNEGLSAWQATLRSPRITQKTEQLTEEAKSNLLETIRINPTHGDAQLTLAELQVNELSKHVNSDPTQIKDAKEHIDNALKLIPNNWKVQYLALKFNLLTNPDYQVSEEELNTLKASLPQDANAWYTYAFLQTAYLNNPIEALSAAEEALRIDPQHKKSMRLKKALNLN